MSDHVIVKRSDRVMTVTINRPDKKNALTQAMYGAIADSLSEYSTNDELRAFLLTGSGDAFTSGNDLADFSSGPKDGEEPGVSRFLRLLKKCPKPVLAAVNGTAIGVGLTMLLHCDVVIASTEATFSAPFVSLGLVPEAASSYLLPAALGTALANDLFLTGRSLTAEEAMLAGLISRAVEPASLSEIAQMVAEQVASSAPSAARRTKALVRFQADLVDERMKVEGQMFAEQLRSPDFAESIAAMRERRPPSFD